MSLKKKLTENWRNGAIGAASAVFLGFVFWGSLGNGLRYLSYDLPLSLRPPLNVDEVTIVLMEEESRSKLNQDASRPWDRTIHARLVKELTARGAKAVVFDILFDDASANTNTDYELAEAIKAHGKVILAATSEKRVEQNAEIVKEIFRLVPPADPIGAAAAGHGAVELGVEKDGKIRRHHFDLRCTSLAWATATALGLNPGSQHQMRWLNFFGSAGNAIRTVPYHQALDPQQLGTNFFKDKVVFVGIGHIITAKGPTTDVYPTPAGAKTYGVEIQATALLNLLRQNWLSEMPESLQRWLLLFAGCLVGYGLTLVRPWLAAALAIGAFAVVTVTALMLYWKQHQPIWFPWLLIGAVQIPCALTWAILSNTRKLYREKEVLEETLSKVKSGVFSSPSPEPVAPMAIALPGGRVMQIGSAPGAAGEGQTLVVSPGGPQIPDHQLVRCIGKGAYGEVWLARDIIGSYHAVKVVYRKTFSNDGPFEREFRGIQKFTPISRSHAGFVHILHVGRNERDGYFYYIMEVGDDEVTGQNIEPTTYSAKNLAREIHRRGKLPLEECLQLSLDLTAALDYLHQQQLIHRDIKPSNIIFVNGVPKIADIGLVTDVAEKGKDVTYIGTDGYIPPEGPGSPAADVYSLGKVLYETAMGRSVGNFPELPSTLFERPDHRQLINFNEIILKACEVNAAIRYKTAGEMRTDLLKLKTRDAQRNG